MYQQIAFCLLFLVGVTVSAQTTVNVRGKVTNLAGKPISSATVTLARQGMKATTGTDGAYTITGTVAVLPEILPQTEKIALKNGILEFTLSNPTPAMVEIFDVTGNLLKKEIVRSVAAGVYRFNIAKNCPATNLLLIKASMGKHVMTFRSMPFNDGKNTLHLVDESSAGGGLAKAAAVVDTVKTSAANYLTKSVTITNYDQELNISLDTAGGGTKPSAGCGKATTLKGEQRLSITVGTQTREYIIRLPDDYEVNTPYKLHFSIHCLGGTAKGVADASGYEYYGIWKYANPSGQKGTTIFCSPEGLKSTIGGGSSLGWDNKNGVDVQFIRALIQKFENELCIDQSRIFSEGFSMGGSMSYALACAMPDTFKAICMHSGGPMSGCDQSHRGPVSMFITHGTSDPACPYPDQAGWPQLKDLAARDSCATLDIPSVCKPTDQSGANPACASFTGCKTGFFCRACIFVGGHDYMAGGGASKTWIDDSTWSYFKQF
jgi:hypothetical protein